MHEMAGARCRKKIGIKKQHEARHEIKTDISMLPQYHQLMDQLGKRVRVMKKERNREGKTSER